MIWTKQNSKYLYLWNKICPISRSVFISTVLLFWGNNSLYSSPCVIYIHFFDSAEVKNEKILLGDIGRISVESNCDNSFFYQLSNLFIGEAAPAGYTRYVDVYEVLHTYIKPQFSDISTGGADRVKVRTDAYVKTVGDYESQIISFLTNKMHWSKNEVKITLKNPDKKWKCYKKDFNITFDGIKTPFPRGNIKFFMKITQGKKIQSIPVLCNIKVYTNVVSAAQRIPRNERIEKRHLRLAPMDITNFKYIPFTSVGSVLDHICVKTLSPGTIIHMRCIKPVPDVLRGDRVNIVLRRGRIKLSVSGRAREEGKMGDRILVENIQSHKLMKMIIIGKGLVSPIQGESL